MRHNVIHAFTQFGLAEIHELNLTSKWISLFRMLYKKLSTFIIGTTFVSSYESNLPQNLLEREENNFSHYVAYPSDRFHV